MKSCASRTWIALPIILMLAVCVPAAWPRQQQSSQQESSTQQRETWNIGVRPPNWTGTSSLEIMNRCRHNHVFEVLTTNLPFVRFLADTHNIPVPGHNSKKLPVQFDTNGMEPGSYNGQVIVHCIDCPKEPTCTQDREYVPVQLVVAQQETSPQPNQPPSEPQPSQPSQPNPPAPTSPPKEEPKQSNAQQAQPPVNVPQERTNQQRKENEEEEYFLPAGMIRLNRAAAQKWWASPFPPPGVFWWWCCCCCPTPQAPAPAPKAGPGPAPKPPISVTLSLIVGRFGPGKAIHIVYVAYGGQYLAETYLQWSASGGSGQLTVELEVQRPGSTRWETLTTGRGPNDEYLFSTRSPGTYLFKVTAKDSAGQSSFNTLSVTFPSI